MPDILSTLNMRCDVYKSLQATASPGDTTEAFVITVQNAPCRWVPDTTTEGIRYLRETNRAFGRFFLRPTIDIDGRDRIVFQGRTFEVTGFVRQYDDVTGLVAHLECLVEETV